jgi:ketosteroid isomerase-like protein
MKSLIVGLLFLLVACGTAMSQKTESTDTGSQTAELERISRDWMDAMVKHDRAKLESLMAPEYALKNWDNSKQSVGRTAWLDALFNHIKIEKFEQKAISANVYGDVGVVTSKYIWIGSVDGRPFDSKGYITDVLRRDPEGWKVVSRTSGGIPGSKLLNGTVSVW